MSQFKKGKNELNRLTSCNICEEVKTKNFCMCCKNNQNKNIFDCYACYLKYKQNVKQNNYEKIIEKNV